MKKNSTEAIPLILDFCHWLEEQKKSPSTISTYKRELLRYQEWLQGKNSDIYHLTKTDIEDYIIYLEEQKKSLSTIDKTVGAIRTFVKFLKKPELTFGIEIKAVEKNKDFETMSLMECDTLLNEVKEDGDLRNIAIVYVLLHTGIRVSELCSLNRSNIDLAANELIVKRNEEERIIPLSADARDHLQSYLQSHESEEAIFINQSGDRITEGTVQYMLKKYNVNPNKLRHTFCQRLVDAKVDLETISRLAGIKDLNEIKRYLRKSQFDNRKIEEVINHVFINETHG